MVGDRGWRKAGVAALFLAPSLIVLVAFWIGPMIGTVWVSLQDWNLIGEPTFAGLANYTELLGDADLMVGDAARVVLRQKQGAGKEDGSMLLKIEKVLLLKAVEFFQSTSDQALVELADLVSELDEQRGRR